MWRAVQEVHIIVIYMCVCGSFLLIRDIYRIKYSASHERCSTYLVPCIWRRLIIRDRQCEDIVQVKPGTRIITIMFQIRHCQPCMNCRLYTRQSSGLSLPLQYWKWRCQRRGRSNATAVLRMYISGPSLTQLSCLHLSFLLLPYVQCSYKSISYYVRLHAFPRRA